MHISGLPLNDLANHINALAVAAEDARLDFCRAMAEARQRVPRETGMAFVVWAQKHLVQANGRPWSKWTLYSYASYGADPQKLVRLRQSVAAHGRSARIALKAVRQPHADQSTQVNVLMTAWEAASDGARAQFLHLIGAEFIRRKSA